MKIVKRNKMESLNQSFCKIGHHINLFNIELCEAEKINLLELLSPLEKLLECHPNNSIYFYKSGEMYYSESLVKVGERYGSATSAGMDLNNMVLELIPKVIDSTNPSNLFPRYRQLSLE